MNRPVDERLTIKQLSKHGELLDCINCMPGKVTVLRAESETDLVAYRQALYGHVSGRKLVVSYNNSPFKPDDAILIGFENLFSQDLTVSEILSLAGAAKEQLPVLLTTFGLDWVSEKLITELNPDFRRRVEILGAIYSRRRIFILDNPFAPVDPVFKDKFAQLIVDDAVQNKRITLITKLDYRPEQWIDNRTIERVQVGATVQKTIGFDSKVHDINKIVDELRAPKPAPVAPVPARIDLREMMLIGRNYLKKAEQLILDIPPPVLRKIGLSVIGFTAFLLVLTGMVGLYGKSRSEVVAKNSISNNSSVTPSISAAPNNSASDSSMRINMEPAHIIENSALKSLEGSVPPSPLNVFLPPKPEQSKTILDSYGPEIKDAVMRAFNEEATESAPLVNAKQETKSKGSLFDSLKYLKPSQSSETLETHNPFFSQGMISPPSDPGQEEIRQRFLEALQAARMQ